MFATRLRLVVLPKCCQEAVRGGGVVLSSLTDCKPILVHRFSECQFSMPGSKRLNCVMRRCSHSANKFPLIGIWNHCELEGVLSKGNSRFAERLSHLAIPDSLSSVSTVNLYEKWPIIFFKAESSLFSRHLLILRRANLSTKAARALYRNDSCPLCKGAEPTFVFFGTCTLFSEEILRSLECICMELNFLAVHGSHAQFPPEDGAPFW